MTVGRRGRKGKLGIEKVDRNITAGNMDARSTSGGKKKLGKKVWSQLRGKASAKVVYPPGGKNEPDQRGC